MTAPTIRDLINAIQDGVTDLSQAQLLVADPEAYATQLGKWGFNTAGGATDKRIDKFKAMTFEGFALANEKYSQAKTTGLDAAAALAGDYARVMCAAASIVKWRRPVGATDDKYLDEEAKIP